MDVSFQVSINTTWLLASLSLEFLLFSMCHSLIPPGQHQHAHLIIDGSAAALLSDGSFSFSFLNIATSLAEDCFIFPHLRAGLESGVDFMV